MRALPEDVTAALSIAGLRARAWQNVTTIRFPALRRATYRIELEDGATIKARCLEDASAAHRAFETRRAAPDAFVPAFLCHGRVLLERWVDGALVGRAMPAEARIVEAAGLLAALHGTHADQHEGTGREPTDGWRTRTEDGLRTLAGRDLLAAGSSRTLGDALERHDPRRAVIGIGHFDFCGENMVVDGHGRLCVFDNERVGPGPLGFDLARAWYRWALPPGAWAAFLEAYRAAPGSAAGAIDELRFWVIAVLVHSACLRLDAGARRLSVPLDRLRELTDASALESVG